jgi:hypothetical protein
MIAKYEEAISTYRETVAKCFEFISKCLEAFTNGLGIAENVSGRMSYSNKEPQDTGENS